MTHNAKYKPYKRIALVFSLFALVLWAMLGTGASLAWFTDTSSEVNNIFHFADFELAVSHRLSDGSWESVDSQTKLFDDDAAYEPGHVQVVYLKVENKGESDFQFRIAVSVMSYTQAENVYGDLFSLQDHLKFGLVSADSEEAMKNSVPNRQSAARIATTDLNNYTTESAVIAAGESTYITLIVRMPKEVDNIANFRGDVLPKVELGLIVTAEQIIK